jgi:hypothetical protein
MQESEHNKQEKPPMFGWMPPIGRVRDLAFIVAGVTYILGYIVWSINAYVNGLGMLPAIEAQYFIAGVIPLVIILLVYFTIRAFQPFVGLIVEIISTFPEKLHFTLLIFAYIIPCATGITMLVLHYHYPDSLFFLTTLLILWFVSFFSVYFISRIRFIGLTSSVSYLYNLGIRILRPASYMYALLLGFVAISIYVSFLYPLIPQEFGGLRPQSAYMDITYDQTSANTLSEIFPDDVAVNNNSVIRSKMVDIYFSGSDVILIKLHTQSGRDSQTFKVKQSIIQTLTWCESSQNETETNPSD